MMSLAIVVEASRTVSETASRTAKVAALAACLRKLSPDEVEIATAFLSGEPRQGKLGVGYAGRVDVRSSGAATDASLTLGEVDQAFTSYASTVGRGSSARRAALLRGLFERATPVEQDFLVRLLVGELRQGALEGVMLDAVAVAASARPEDVRRAAMYAGSVPVVARVALTEEPTD